MNVHDLLGRLEKVRKSVVRNGAQNWTAKCPAHEDKGPSLSVGEAPTGRILLHCFAGCSVDAIVGALGLDLEDLFPPRQADEHRAPPIRKPWSQRDVARAFELEATEAFLYLAKMGGGARLSVAERKRCGVLAPRLAALIHEISGET